MTTAAEREATRIQRRAAEPQASVWVAASAGTGKTKVLTDRVLSLLVAGCPPERILCLTFTKAAAAEMAIRVTKRLGAWATAETDAKLDKGIRELTGKRPGDEARARARQLFARVLDVPGGMKIQTIHSFCQSLLGRFPLEAGVVPHFDVIDERTAAEMLSAAREEVLARALPSIASAGADPVLADALAEVSGWLHGEGFARLMEALAKERARLRRLIEREGGRKGLRTKVFAELGISPGETEGAVLAGACADVAFDGPALKAAAKALSEGFKTDRERSDLIAAWLEAGSEDRARGRLWNGYRRAFLTRTDRMLATLATKGVEEAHPGTLETLASEAERIAGVTARLKARAVAGATAALLTLGAAVVEAYDRLKETRALLDYDDLILSAHKLLTETEAAAAWVLFKLDGGLDHILIDEAQDTNPEQWQVVQVLAEEFLAGIGAREERRTVFAVGDVKQSIYSFQRADPAEFERMRAHFAERILATAGDWRPLDLAVCFRSVGAVLDAVDAVFADERASDGVALDSQPIRHICFRQGQAGLVELWPPAEPEEPPETEPWEPPLKPFPALSAQARLARVIAGRIKGWFDEGEMLEARGRRLHPGDVMVLVRRRTHFVEELVRGLKLCGVPVAGVDRLILTEQLGVMDLVALGRFLLLPEDDLTLATVLKSPLVGLTEDHLFELCWERGEHSVWQRLGAMKGGNPAFERAHGFLSRLLARVDFVSPFDLYSEVLSAQGGRKALLARLGPDAGDPLDELLELALAYERANAPSLQGFLHWLEAGRAEIKRDLEQAVRDEVRVMTVHGAKGLQAPVVILPDTLQTPAPQTDLVWLGRDRVALWAPRVALDAPETARARADARLAREREYRRLLYVAMTRAEDRLYVTGWHTRRSEPEDCWYRMIEQGLAGLPGAETVIFDFAPDASRVGRGGAVHGWQGEGWRYEVTQVDAVRHDARFAEAPPTPAGLEDWARHPAPAEPSPPRPLVPSAPAAEDSAPRSPLGEGHDDVYLRGRLIHRLLQTLPTLARGEREAAAQRFLALPVHGLGPERRDEIWRETLAVLSHPDFAPLFGLGSLAEVPLVGRIGEAVISGQVDRLCVEADRVLVVDYKTNRPPLEVVEDVPGAYLRQLAAYRAVLAEIYPDRPVVSALLWTDGPRLMAIPDAVLAAHAPAGLRI